MNRYITIVFSAYQSHDLLKKAIKKLPRKYKIIVIENSLDKKLKVLLEKKYKNVEVIIPEENLGLAKSYNLGLKKSKTKYVFLNNPDHEIKEDTIKKLFKCTKSIGNFAIISPTYKDEKIYKNYEIYEYKNLNNSKSYKKFGIAEVDIIDNCFFVKKDQIKNNYFDEKYFLYFETFDFCKNLRKNGKKLFVCNNIKYHHIGANSVNKKFEKIVKYTRAYHYNWSKFYFFKKNFSLIIAFRKILPNFIKALKKIIISILKFDKSNLIIGLIEIYGILSAILFLKSFYRPKM